MPPRSEAQRRAMGAAASGKSTIGIPQDVGSEYMAADAGGSLPPYAPKKKAAKAKGKGLNAMVKRQKRFSALLTSPRWLDPYPSPLR